MWLVWAAWAILLFDIHVFLGVFVAAPFLRLSTAVLLPLMALMALQAPIILTTMRRWVWYPPYVLYVAAAVLSLPVAVNLTMAQEHLQFLVVFYMLAVATAVYIRTPSQIVPILAILAGRFVWWAIWGRANGLIAWHWTLANYDGFGGLMVVGVPTCFWFGLAARSKWTKRLLLATAAYCVVGVIASFARGAFLALAVVAFIIWLRSRRKMMTAIGLVAGGLVAVVAAAQLFGLDAFIAEMRSAFEEGADEGTGLHRMVLWTSATRVWMEHPIFGVGVGNWGAFASRLFRQGEVPGFENPNAFWGVNTHNGYVQVLAEQGIVGLGALLWLIVDFFRKNRVLLRPEAIARWNASALSAKFDLRSLALGLEGAMVATMLSNMVYATLYEPWLITILAANRMLWAFAWPAVSGNAPDQTGARVARAPRSPVRQRSIPSLASPPNQPN